MSAAFLLCVLGGKFLLIRGWGTEVPYWDQWDAEGSMIVRQAEGTLGFRDLFQPHNEHRIVPTRALALTLLALNGQWDARLQMVVNAALHATALLFLLWVARSSLPREAWWLLVAATALLFALPFGWENTLAGFQSQFYFVLLFGILHIAGGVLARPGTLPWCLAHVAGAAGLLAMASGFLSAIVVATLTAARMAVQRRRAGGAEWVGLGLCGLMIAAGFWLRTEVPGHGSLRAPNLWAWAHSFAWLTAWPSPSLWAAPLVLVPGCAVAVLAWRARFQEAGLNLAVAIVGWALLQNALLAYARGGDAFGLSSRYFDMFALGLVAGALSWLQIVGRLRNGRARWTVAVGLTAWLVVVGLGIRYQTERQWRSILDELPAVNRAREHAVREFVAGRRPSLEGGVPWSELPYPAAGPLEAYLRSPAIRAVLPPVVREPLPVVPDPATAGFRRDALPRSIPPPPGGSWSSFGADGVASFRSGAIQTQYPLIRFHVTGELDAPAGALSLMGGDEVTNVRPAVARRANWGGVTVSAPDEPFAISARSAPGHWLAFTAPVEVGALSWGAGQVLKCGMACVWAGGGLLLLFAASGCATRGRGTFTLLADAWRQGRARAGHMAGTWNAACHAWLAWPHATRGVIVVAVAAMLLFARKPDALFTPQLWGEDGSIFLVQQEQHGWKAWAMPYAGYIHLIPRIVATLASWGDPCGIPALYNGFAYLCWVAVAASFLSARVMTPGRWWLPIAVALVPQTGEVLFQLCNIQWVTALVLVRQLLIRPAAGGRALAGDAVLLLAIGLTGPFAVIFLPLFAWRAWSERSRGAWVELGCLALAAGLHVTAGLLAPGGLPRAEASADVLALAAFVGQRTLGVMLVGWDAAANSARWVNVGCFVLLVAGAVIAWRRSHSDSRREIALLAAVFALLIGSTLVRGGRGILLESIGFGDRYLFIPRLVVVAVALVCAARGVIRPWVLITVACWSLWINRSQFQVPAPPDFRWRDYCHQLQSPEPAEIPILPPGWILQYPGRQDRTP